MRLRTRLRRAEEQAAPRGGICDVSVEEVRILRDEYLRFDFEPRVSPKLETRISEMTLEQLVAEYFTM